MDLVKKIADRKDTIKIIAVVFVIVVCLSAMFYASSTRVHLPSQIDKGGLPIIVLIVIGFAIGCYGTIVGIGGGPLIMPVLILCYDWDSALLVGTSLFIVFLNALSGSIGYARQKRIDYKGGIKFALAAFPGAIISSLFHYRFNIKFFDVVFGIFLVFLAVYSFLSLNKKRAQKSIEHSKKSGYRHVGFVDNFGQTFDFYSNDTLGIRMNILLGFFIGFLGIGGGVFQVPILLFLLYYPTHIATATSHFITMLVCAFALIPHLFLANIYFGEALWMGLGVIAGAQIGVRLAPKLHSKLIIYLFIVVLLVFALELFIK